MQIGQDHDGPYQRHVSWLRFCSLFRRGGSTARVARDARCLLRQPTHAHLHGYTKEQDRWWRARRHGHARSRWPRGSTCRRHELHGKSSRRILWAASANEPVYRPKQYHSFRWRAFWVCHGRRASFLFPRLRGDYLREDSAREGLRFRPIRSASRSRDGDQPNARLSHWQLSSPPQLGTKPKQFWSGWHPIPSGTSSACLPIYGHAPFASLRQFRSFEGRHPYTSLMCKEC